MMLRGCAIRQTEKAVYFSIHEDELGHLEGKRFWFPKSQVRQSKSRDKQFDVLRMPNWLYDSKRDEPEQN